MKFIKNKKIPVILVCIIFVIYNIVVFAVPFSRNADFWIAYAFSILAMILTATVGYYTFKKEGLKSKFYGVSFAYVVWRHLIIQLALGLLEIFFDFIPYYYGIAVNAILLGTCLIGLIGINTDKGKN